MGMYLSGLLWGLMLLSTGRSLAQKSLSLTVAGQAHLTGGRFVGDQLVSARINVVPTVYRDWLLGVVVDLTPRYAVQATFGQPNYGLSFRTQRDYRRSPEQDANVATFQQQAFEYAVVLRRHFFVARTPARRWFADLGLDLIDISQLGGGGSFGFSGTDPSLTTGPGIEANGVLDMRNPNRVGVRLGLGHEWALNHGNRHFFSLQAVGSVGLRDLQRHRMSAVVWERGRTVDPIYYRNQVATRLSFVGLQARYRFQL